ncbi:MAG: hypothetical protein OEZ06_30725 [Myxococcales bacterium]|nr:hypothetical protein [Myxococcales bacterium]
MDQRAFFGLSAACWLLLAACSAAAPSAPLLELSALEPELLEEGTRLAVTSADLPVGRSCELRLHGLLFRPAAAPRPVDVSLAGSAVTQARVEAVLDAGTIAQLGGHGTLEGELVVSFATLDGRGRVEGRRAVRLDLLDAGAAVGARRRARAEAERLLLELGIVLADDQPTSQGLSVRWARDASAAAMAGIRSGDVLSEAAGVRIHTPADVLPPPGAPRLQLRVQTPGGGGDRLVLLSLSGLGAEPGMAATLAAAGPRGELALGVLSAALAWALVSLLLLSPLSLRWRALVSPATWPPQPPAKCPWQHRALAASALFSLALLAARPGVFAAFSVHALALVCTGVAVTLAALALWARPRRGLGPAFCAALLGLLPAGLAALDGGASLEALVAAQGSWPGQWAVATRPALGLGLLSLWLCWAGLGAQTGSALDAGLRAAVSAMTALVGLGGFHAAALPLALVATAGVGSAAVLGLKLALSWWLLGWLRAQGLAARAGARGLVALVASALSMAALFSLLGTPAVVEAALGRGLLAGLLLALLGARWLAPARAVRRRLPMALPAP